MSHTLYPPPQPVAQPSNARVFDLDTDEERFAEMRRLGAKNAFPPLPRSTHLRVKSSGRVLPWDETLAEQRDLLECCDATGNTDPAAWLPQVSAEEYDVDERRILMLQAQEYAITQHHARTMTADYQQPNPVDLNAPQTTGYPAGAVPYDDIENLLRMVQEK